ncbi:MAG: hypothetical protein P8Z50_03210 [candidate division WOR-3 bacterium]
MRGIVQINFTSRKISAKFLFLLLSLFSSTYSYAHVIRNATVEFTRTLRKGKAEETTNGILYCKIPEEILVYVDEPVCQWLSFENNSIKIYYPEDSIAFKLISSYPVSFSFFNTFLNVMKEDFGLCDIGYILSEHKIKGDTLITFWRPSKRLSKTIENLKLVYINNKIISCEVKRTDGEFMLKSFYREHFNYREYYFPMEISTTIFMDGDTIFETILYKNPVFNGSLPEEVKNFKIPEGIEIEEIKW